MGLPKVGQRGWIALVKGAGDDIAIFVFDAKVPDLTVSGSGLLQSTVKGKLIFQQHRLDNLPRQGLDETLGTLR